MSIDRKPSPNSPNAAKSSETFLGLYFLEFFFGRSLGNKAISQAWWRRWIYPLLLLLTLSLSLATYLSLDSIQASVDDYINDNQRALVGGDLIISSNQDWPPELLANIQKLNADNVVMDYRFNAMLTTDKQTQLGYVKAVSTNYPLYGEVKLGSNKPLWQQLSDQNVIVAPEVLTGLNAKIGDNITIGEGQFTIIDTLIKEPDRPLTAFGFGGRVMMSEAAVAKTKLIGERSRVSYKIALKGSADSIAAERESLSNILTHYPDIKLSDAQSADTSITRISDNVLLFLKLLVIAVLLLALVAMFGIITAFVNKQQSVNATRLALGESRRAVNISYYRLFGMSAILSWLIATVLSIGFLIIARPQLGAILPADISLSISPISVIKTLIIALVLTLFITHRALINLAKMQLTVLLQDDVSAITTKFLPQKKSWLKVILIGLVLFGFFTLEAGSWQLALGLLVGLVAVLIIFWGLAQAWLWVLAALAKRHKIGLLPRLAIHNLSRKGNQSALFFMTLALSVAVLALVATLNHSITKQFVTSYPKDAPNLFLLDVQSDQHDSINQIINAPVTYFPVIRARVVSANGVKAADIVPKDGFDDPTRVFNLSYSNEVMDTEFIKSSVKKDALFAPVSQDKSQLAGALKMAPMSILDTAADLLNVKMGDEVRFNIQGIEIIGKITSIRSRFEQGPSPFFYFLFEPDVLAKAPQIQFATAHVEKQNIAPIQGELTRRYPAITTVDGAMIAEQVQALIAQMSRLVFVFTLLALITGIMVLISSLLATTQERLKDSASYRLLGMQQRDLYALNIIEIILIGSSAAIFSLVVASLGAWFVVTQKFQLPFSLPWLQFLLGLTALLIILIAIALIYVRLVIGRGIMARVRALI